MKYRNIVKKYLVPVVAGASTIALTTVSAFATSEDPTITAMDTAIKGTQTNILAGLAKVAPYGLAIMGAFLVWKYGAKFFKGLAGK